MFRKKIKYFIAFILLLLAGQSFAQDTTSNMLYQKQLDRLYLKRPFSEVVAGFKNSVKVKWNKAFVNFANNETYLFAGMNLSKQTITSQNYQSAFNYKLDIINKNVFNPGYFGGVRIDGKYKEKYPYSFSFALNKYATGTNYKNGKSIEPYIGTFSNFKAEQQMLILSFAAHYKYNMVLGDTSKRKLYFVAGPSLDFRFSNQSLDNRVNNLYKAIFVKADLGIEFDNQSYYTLFLHYKQGVHSITKSPIKDYIGSFELGMLIKASDLF